MPAFSRAEVWTNLQAAGGTRVAVIPDPASVEPIYDITGDEQLTVRVLRSSPAYAQLLEKRVIRVFRKDGTWDEWRISGRVEQSGNVGGPPTVITARPVLFDLGDVVIRETLNNGETLFSGSFAALSLAEAFDNIIIPQLAQAGVTWWGRGTFDATDPFDWTFEDVTVLSLLRNWAEKFQLELAVRPNGTTGYFVDLVNEIGATAPMPLVTTRKNLENAQRTVATNEQATRVIPRGSPGGGTYKSSIAQVRWKVSAIGGGRLTLVDELGIVLPIAFDDQLNTWRVFREAAGTVHEISDTFKATQEVSLTGGTTGFVVGDLVTLRMQDGVTWPTALEAPVEVQPPPVGYGVIERFLDRGDLYGATNLVPNPFMRQWTGSMFAAPNGYTLAGDATVARDALVGNTDYGGYSALVDFNTNGEFVSPSFRVWTQGLPSRGVVSIRVRIKFDVFTADCSFGVLIASTGGALVKTPVLMRLFPADHPTAAPADKVTVATWYDLVITATDLAALFPDDYPVELRLFVQQGAGGGSCAAWVDVMQVTQTNYDPAVYVETSAAVDLWDVGNRYLTAFKGPVIEYQVDLRDLERLDGSPWATDKIVPGGKMRLIDTQLGIDATPRVIRYMPNELEPLSSRVTLSNRLKSLTQLLQLLGGIGSTRVSNKQSQTITPSTTKTTTTPTTTGTTTTQTTSGVAPGVLHVPFFARKDPDDDLVLANIPVGATEVDEILQKPIPLTLMITCRLSGYVTEAALVAGTSLQLGYSVDNGATMIPVGNKMKVDTLGPVVSDWATMPLAMLADVVIGLMMLAGANIAGAKLSSVAAQFANTLPPTPTFTGGPASITIAPTPLDLALEVVGDVCNSNLYEPAGFGTVQNYGQDFCAFVNKAEWLAGEAADEAISPTSPSFGLGVFFYDMDVEEVGIASRHIFGTDSTYNGGHHYIGGEYESGYAFSWGPEGLRTFTISVYRRLGTTPWNTYRTTYPGYGPYQAYARLVVEFSPGFQMDQYSYLNLIIQYALQSTTTFGNVWNEGLIQVGMQDSSTAPVDRRLTIFFGGNLLGPNVDVGDIDALLFDGQPHELELITTRYTDPVTFQEGGRYVTLKLDGTVMYSAIHMLNFGAGDPRHQNYIPTGADFMEWYGPSFGGDPVTADQYYRVVEFEYRDVGGPTVGP